MEQALGLLYSNGHDLEKSNRDLSIFAPVDNWSIFDTTRFEYAFDKLGKDFVGIREMVINTHNLFEFHILCSFSF